MMTVPVAASLLLLAQTLPDQRAQPRLAAQELTFVTGQPADPRAVQVLRRHGWDLLEWVLRDASRRGTHNPQFFSWCTDFEVLRGVCERGVHAAPSRPPELQFGARRNERGKDLPGILTVVSEGYYNPALSVYFQGIRQMQSAPKKVLDLLAAERRELPDMPESAIVVKPAWQLIPCQGEHAFPVWQGEDSPTGAVQANGSINGLRLRRQMIDTASMQDGPCEPRAAPNQPPANLRINSTRLPIRDFFTFQAPRDVTLMSGKEIREGDFLLLAGLHVITRELKDWIWATYWWHPEDPRVTTHRFASGRERFLTRAKGASLRAGARFRMDIAVTDERAIFNPYLEGTLTGGTRSRCIGCHRKATLHRTPPAGNYRCFQFDSRAVPSNTETPRVFMSFLWSAARWFGHSSNCLQ
jgi:hypothetical protein